MKKKRNLPLSTSHYASRSGFSLAEVLIVVAIAASVVIVVSNLGGNVNLLNNLVGQQLQSKSDISQTLQIMTTEIRSAGPSQNGAYPIDSAASSSFAFYSDVNKNGQIYYVKYFLASTSIEKMMIQPTGSPAVYSTSSAVTLDVVDNVSLASGTPLFSYYDSSYTGSQPPLAQPVAIQSVRLVGVNFYSDVQPNQAPGPQYFSMMVDIRNLRSN